MQIIKQNTTYALHALLHMANSPADTSFTAEQLAAASGATIDFMHKIMQSLRRANLVASQRGPGGGFRLDRAPEDLPLLDVVVAVQGPLTVTDCVMGIEVCRNAATCPLQTTWAQVQQLIEKALTENTLADITTMEVGGCSSSAHAPAHDRRNCKCQ